GEVVLQLGEPAANRDGVDLHREVAALLRELYRPPGERFTVLDIALPGIRITAGPGALAVEIREVRQRARRAGDLVVAAGQHQRAAKLRAGLVEFAQIAEHDAQAGAGTHLELPVPGLHGVADAGRVGA